MDIHIKLKKYIFYVDLCSTILFTNKNQQVIFTLPKELHLC